MPINIFSCLNENFPMVFFLMHTVKSMGPQDKIPYLVFIKLFVPSSGCFKAERQTVSICLSPLANSSEFTPKSK